MVVQICQKCLCIYGFVNNFWMGRIFERPRKVCGGSNLSTDLLLWGIYIKKCISPVRIRLRVKKPRNASTKFRKTSESENSPNPLWRIGAGEISRNLPFSRFSSSGSKLTCHHVSIRRFRCVRSCQPIQMHPKGRLPPWQEPDLQITAVFRDCKIVRVNGNYVSNLPI